MSQSASPDNLEQVPAKGFLAVCETAAGMLYQDRFWIGKLYLLLVLPPYLASTSSGFQLGLILQIAERFFELGALFLIGKRWLAKLKNSKSSNELQTDNFRQFIVLVSYGFALWLLFQGPAVFVLTSPLPALKLLGMITWSVTIMICLIYYFYFLPILLGRLDFASIRQQSRELFNADRLLALKTLVTPFALLALFTNLLGIFQLDNGVQSILNGKTFFGALYFILASYLAMAAGLLSLKQKEWHDFGLDPYREARFGTLRLMAPAWLAKLLLPGSGLKLMIVAILLGLANMAALAGRAPQAEIKVQAIAITGSQLKITLHATATPDQLNNLVPVMFSIAGPEGQTISESRQPVEIKMNGRPFNPFQSIIRADQNQLTIELLFNTNRQAQDLQQLNDLYLWYNQARLQLLNMTKATIVATDSESPKF